MPKASRRRPSPWTALLQPRRTQALSRQMQRTAQALVQPWMAVGQARMDSWLEHTRMPPGPGRWVPGLALGPAGGRSFQLYLPASAGQGLRRPALPLLVMLHGCHQDAASFAHSTRMQRLAERERFAVLYLQQDRRANAQGCWNWFEQRSGAAQREMRTVLAAIDQACLLYGIDAQRVAVAGLSAGASLAAQLAQQHPHRFCAVVMHSGVAPGTAHDARSALPAMRGHGRRNWAATASAATAATAAAAATVRLKPAANRLAAAAAVPVWPPLLVIHGDRDALVSPRNALLSVAQWVAHHGGARAAEPSTVQRGQRLPRQVRQWRRQGQDVATLVMVQGLGHAWSGGPAQLPFCTPDGPDASAIALRFVLRQWRGGPAD